MASEDGVGHCPRQLTEEEYKKLQKDDKLVSEFKQNKLEAEAQRNWDIFYKRNTTKFFKDRHWTKREFGDLISRCEGSDKLVVFEVGCGVGNFMFPLLEEDKNLYFYACDFSKRAVQFVKENPAFDPSRCTAFHCDVTQDELTDHVPVGSVDVATMIFVLSAIHPEKMVAALRKVLEVLKPGGCLLIRDYGQYDYAMLRFAPGHKLSDNFYVRQDGTRAYYFSMETLEDLMVSAGYQVGSREYIQRQTVNKKEALSVPRIFVQGKFMKPQNTDMTTDTDCVTDSVAGYDSCQNRANNQSQLPCESHVAGNGGGSSSYDPAVSAQTGTGDQVLSTDTLADRDQVPDSLVNNMADKLTVGDAKLQVCDQGDTIKNTERTMCK